MLALKLCIDLKINFFKENNGCCIYVNFTGLYNSGLNSRLAFVLGLVTSFKHLYGETVRKATLDQHSAKEVTVLKKKWNDLDSLIKLISKNFSVLYPQQSEKYTKCVLQTLLKPLEPGQGLIFSYDGLDRDLKCQVLEFENPTQLNGIDPNLSKFPAVLIADSFRKNSKIQNQTQNIKQLLELRIFLTVIGITDFTKCNFPPHQIQILTS